MTSSEQVLANHNFFSSYIWGDGDVVGQLFESTLYFDVLTEFSGYVVATTGILLATGFFLMVIALVMSIVIGGVLNLINFRI